MGITTIDRFTGRQLKNFLDKLNDEDLDLPLWLYGQTEVVSVEVKWSYLNNRAELVLEGSK